MITFFFKDLVSPKPLNKTFEGCVVCNIGQAIKHLFSFSPRLTYKIYILPIISKCKICMKSHCLIAILLAASGQFLRGGWGGVGEGRARVRGSCDSQWRDPTQNQGTWHVYQSNNLHVPCATARGNQSKERFFDVTLFKRLIILAVENRLEIFSGK